jgi:hypothetical protein
MPRERPKLQCSFCGKDQTKVQKLIAGPGVFICDECVDLSAQIIAEETGDRPRLASVEAMTDEQLFQGLRQAAAAAAQAEYGLHERIAELRGRGHTWTQLGTALGVSRQAAWERFARGGRAGE